MMLEVVDAITSVKRRWSGRPRKRPAKLHADKAYDSKELRAALRERGITPRIARRGVESSERLGRYRWMVAGVIWQPKRSRIVSQVLATGMS